jgi:hypothetical protein
MNPPGMNVEVSTSTTLGISPLQSLRIPFMQASRATFSTVQVLEIVFALVFAVWAIYTLVVFYHWIRYGHSLKAGIPALIIHLVVSGALFLFAASGFA